MTRMQWCRRPGPRRPCAISKPRPRPSSRLAAGTRTRSKLTCAVGEHGSHVTARVHKGLQQTLGWFLVCAIARWAAAVPCMRNVSARGSRVCNGESTSAWPCGASSYPNTSSGRTTLTPAFKGQILTPLQPMSTCRSTPSVSLGAIPAGLVNCCRRARTRLASA